MVPTFGMFEFELARRIFVSNEDQERAGYLNEVVLNSTQFGASNWDENEVRIAASRALITRF